MLQMVEYRRSEVFLTELMENICDKMKDFVRARLKSNGQLVVIPLFSQAGQMNSMISDVDIIQDSDLNKSLQFYCEGILEENEESFVKRFSEGGENLDIKLCTEAAQLCNHTVEQDYEFEANDEL
uniref:DUF3456 domain-containing protein n=1 Tax=Rhodnius prolixus TaxID=13249 RepID=T1HA39_RHOPR